MKKRILHVISQKPSDTGSGVYLKNVIRFLNEAEHGQGVIYGTYSDDAYSFGCDIQEYPLVFGGENLNMLIPGMSDMMPYPSITYGSLTPEQYGRWKDAFKCLIEDAIKDFEPDVIISNHLWLLTSIVAENAGDIPVYSICHGTDIRQLVRLEHFKKPVLGGVKQLRGIFVLHQEQKQIVEDLYEIPESRIHILGSGFDDELFHQEGRNPPEDKLRIIYAGKLSFAKGIDALIRAYSQCHFSVPVELVLVGSGHGEEMAVIKALAENSFNPIVFAGRLNQEALSAAFRESHVFVLPSFYEGLPLVVIEALASGLHVIVNDLPGLKSVFKEVNAVDGAIQFVNLPRVIHQDSPHPEDIAQYESELKHALRKSEVYWKNEIPSVVLERMTWRSLTYRLLKMLSI